MQIPRGRIFRFKNNELAEYTSLFQTEDIIVEDIKMTPDGFKVLGWGSFLILAVIVIGSIKWNTRRLKAKAHELELMVDVRTRELKETQSQLVKSAQMAGKAEIANEILHNAGNILTSISITLETLFFTLENTRVHKLEKANDLLRIHKKELEVLMGDHPVGKRLPDYYLALGELLKKESAGVLESVKISRHHTNGLIQFIHS